MTISELYKIFEQHPLVTTDTRDIPEGSIFFALKGSNFNGNQFAGEALNKGASFAVIDEPEFASSPQCILVDDTLKALQNLCSYHRSQFNIPVIGITGTNGKTTTKELTNAVLSKKYNVVCTKGNFNNHIGVPLTLLTINKKTEIAIIEMGANHPGEIELLCSFSKPTHGLITNVGKAHLEGFGSFEGVKKTKSELYDFLKRNKGTVFINSDNPVLLELLDFNKCIGYGTATDNFCITKSIQANPFVSVDISFQENNTASYSIKSKLIGKYNAENILAAATIGFYFGVAPHLEQQAIADYIPQNNRSQMIETSTNKILMDAYNANPSSMKLSVENFMNLTQENKVLIIGDMLELGEYSEQEHKEIISQIKKYDIREVYLIGPEFYKHNDIREFQFFQNTDKFIDWAKLNPIKNSFILIKGSRGIQLEKVLPYL